MTEKTDVDLMDEVIKEMDRVWGEQGLEGTPKEYAWLLEHYGISEEEDVQWQLVLQENMGDLPEEDAEDPEVRGFLDDDEAVYVFLAELIYKYKSSDLIYIR